MLPLIITALIVTIGAPLWVLLVGQDDAMLRRLWRGQAPRTWHYETLAICALTALGIWAGTALGGGDWRGWLAFPVTVFRHGATSVGQRLTERLGPAAPHLVECWRHGRAYSLGSYVAGLVAIVALGQWGALVGLVTSFGYSRWRRWYTARR